MTRRAMRSGLISEASIKAALTETKGDIFMTACALDCTAHEVDRYIRRSKDLQSFAAAVEQVKVDPAYASMSAQQFEAQLDDLTRSLRVEGLNEIHKLAVMEFGDSAALAKVKLDAAIALRGGQGSTRGNSEAENTLAELNHLYHANAPRIREIRQTVITLADERDVTPTTFEAISVRE
jgi:hypothetical protein